MGGWNRDYEDVQDEGRVRTHIEVVLGVREGEGGVPELHVAVVVVVSELRDNDEAEVAVAKVVEVEWVVRWVI